MSRSLHIPSLSVCVSLAQASGAASTVAGVCGEEADGVDGALAAWRAQSTRRWDAFVERNQSVLEGLPPAYVAVMFVARSQAFVAQFVSEHATKIHLLQGVLRKWNRERSLTPEHEIESELLVNQLTNASRAIVHFSMYLYEFAMQQKHGSAEL